MCDIVKYYQDSRIQVILTMNIPEALSFPVDGLAYPVRLIENPHPKGFSANRNQALREAKGQFFCVVNPDVRL